MTGNVTGIKSDGSATKREVVPKMTFEAGPDGRLALKADVKLQATEYSKTWRWGDYKWRKRATVSYLPFTFHATWSARKDDDQAFVVLQSTSNREAKYYSPFGDAVTYVANPTGQGDTAALDVTSQGQGGMDIVVASRIRVTLPVVKKPSPPPRAPGPKPIRRTLTIDNFPVGKASVSAENLKKLEDFWCLLTPTTRQMVQNNERIGNRKVQVTGYTSNTDKVTNNFELGYKRAQAVVSILKKISGNAEGSNFAPMTRHERGNPTDDKSKETEDARDRKVVIVIYDMQTAVQQFLNQMREMFGF